MAQPAPLGLDVTELKFKLQNKVPIFKGDGIAKDRCSLLATASEHGLVFAGTVGRAELRLKDITSTTDRVVNETVPLRTVPLPSEPFQLAVSCDHGFLAVDVVANGVPFVYVYSVASFWTGAIVKLHEIKTSPQPGVRSAALCWNPVMHNVLAVRTESGGLAVYTLKEPIGLEFHSLDAAERAQCACWSPKGKQLVVAYANGRLVQYKPDLKPARTIVCPAGVVEGGGTFDVLAVQWLSTYQFAVVFLPHAPDSVPALFVVNAPKVGNPVLINYDDICYSQSGPRAGQVFLQHILPWNLLLMASANSMEVGILGTTEGGEAPTWCQWTTTDEARAELPLTVDKQESFPVGFAFETGCTHELVIGEQTFPVMPMIHLLSTYGQLVSFNVLNTLPNVPNLCSPPKPAQDLSGGAYAMIDMESKSVSAAVPSVLAPAPAPAPAPASEISFAVPNGATSTPAIAKSKSFFNAGGASVGEAVQKSPIALFGAAGAGQQQQHKPPATSVVAPTFGKQITFGGTQPSSLPGGDVKTSPFAGFGGLGTSAAGLPTMSAPTFQTAMASMGATSSNNSNAPPPDATKPLVTVPPTYVPPIAPQSARSQAVAPTAAQKKPDPTATTTDQDSNIIRTLTMDELKRFTRELAEQQQRNRTLHVQIGAKDESAGMGRSLRELEDIIAQEANESTQSLVADVQALRLGLNEAFAMVAEANSKCALFNNPTVHHQYADTAQVMSQTSRRQLSALENMLQVNENQLRTVTKQLEVQWACVEEAKQKRDRQRMHIPSLEVLYQTLSKQQDILHRQGEKLAYLKGKLGLKSALRAESKNVSQSGGDGIESLTDSILSLTLGDQVAADARKLDERKLNALRRVLVGRKVVTVKAQRPDRVGLSSEVVRERRDQVRRSAALEEKEKALKASQQQQQAMQVKKEAEQKKQQPKQSVVQQQPQQAVQKPPATATTNKAFSFGAPAPPPASAAGAGGTFSFGQTTITPMPIPAAKTTTTTTVTEKIASKPASGGGSISTGLTFGASSSTNTKAPEHEKKDKENIPVSIAAPPPASISKPSSGTPFSFSTNALNTSSNAFAKPTLTSNDPPKPVFSFGSAANNSNNQTTLSFGSVPKPNFSFDAPAPPAPASSGAAAGGVAPSDGAAGGVALALTKPKPVDEDTQKDKPLPPAFGPSVETGPSATKSPLPALTSLLQKVDPSPVDAPKTTPGTGLFGSITGGTSAFGSGGSLFGSITKPTAEDATKSTSTSGGGLFSGLSFGSALSTASETGTTGSLFGSVAKPATSTTVADGAAAPPVSSGAGVGLTFGSGFGAATTTSSATSEPAKVELATAASVTTVSAPPASTTPTTTAAPSTGGFGFGSLSFGKPLTTAATSPAVTTATSTAAADTTSNLFGSISICSPSSTAAPTSKTASTATGGNIFSSFAAAKPTDTTSIFGGGGVTSSGGSIFASAAKPAAFGSPASSTTSGGGLFGSVTTPTSTVASTAIGTSTATTTAVVASGGNLFGGFFSSATTAATPATTATSFFGGGAPAGGSIFGTSASSTAATTTGSIFGQSVTSPASTPGGLFGSVAPNVNSSAAAATAGGSIFGGSSAFGAATTGASSGGNIFGSPGGAAAAATPSGTGLFGSVGGGPAPGTNAFGSPQSPAQPQQSIFGGGASSTGGFGASSPGPFSSGGNAFASPTGGASNGASAFSKPPAFGATPTFGGAATFGAAPTFGGTPTFGGAPTFGSPKATFGGGASPFGAAAAPVVGSPTSSNNLFEQLGSSSAGVSFGGLAAQQAAKPTQFGGSSFSSWRS
uniref:Nuclear pore complex protein Nup214 n=1 Tax=Anopheles dirus TaxID=7168 RepID=A0A182NUP6_9DIPT